MKTLAEAASESTCKKRITVCAIFGERADGTNGELACESNRCSPPDGRCARIGMQRERAQYTGDECACQHAETTALAAMPRGSRPHYAIVYGHHWPCPQCEKQLRSAGVEKIDVQQSSITGLR